MLTSLAYIFLLGLSLGYIFSKLKLPALLGMLFTGIILGPYVLNLLSPSILSISADLRQLALVIILTRAGLALDLDDLKKVGRPAFLMCFVPACFEITGMILLAPTLLGISVLEAALLGTVIAAVSPAVIVPKMLFLMENKIGTKKSIPQLIMAGASVDDVFVIVLFTAFTGLLSGGEVSATSFIEIPVAISTGLATGVLFGLLLSVYFKRFHLRDSIKVHCKAQMELMEEVGSTVKREHCHEENDEDLRKAVREACYDKAYAIAASGNRNKHERQDAFDAIRDEFKTQYTEEELEEKGALIDRYYHDVEKEAMRRCILDEGKRLDGRKTTEIRPIWCEVGYLPGPHGSAIFTRGETQSLTSVTLGTKLDEKIVDDVLDQHRERFLLHYNFPPISRRPTPRCAFASPVENGGKL
jgi:hypothetical protein